MLGWKEPLKVLFLSLQTRLSHQKMRTRMIFGGSKKITRKMIIRML